MRRPPALLPAVLVALCGCNPDFEPQYLVKTDEVRILALRAHVEGSDAADATPGDTLVLDALVANPAGRAVTVSWYGCPPPGDESLAPCADPEFLRDPARLVSDPRVLPLGSGESVSVPLPDVTAALQFVIGIALQQPSYQCSLFAEMPVVALVEGDGRRQLALKRVRLLPPDAMLPPQLPRGYFANSNPQVLDVLRSPTDGCPSGGSEPLDAIPFPSGSRFVCGFASPPDGYDRCGPAGEREGTSEALSWQWYVTGGEFPDAGGIGNATDASMEFVRPAGPFTLWAIVRDGRGGEAWVRRDVPAAP